MINISQKKIVKKGSQELFEIISNWTFTLAQICIQAFPIESIGNKPVDLYSFLMSGDLNTIEYKIFVPGISNLSTKLYFLFIFCVAIFNFILGCIEDIRIPLSFLLTTKDKKE